MEVPPEYKEEITSGRTEALFIALMLMFLVFSVLRVNSHGIDGWLRVFAAVSVVFLFYSINYRKLIIRITPSNVKLRFGLFHWRIPLDNIESVFLDPVSLWRIGGAGIHFSFFAGKYRVMFNFLDHDRVVLELKQKQGLIQEIAFTTRKPDVVLELLGRLTTEHSTHGSNP
jgi:hypothetical protein